MASEILPPPRSLLYAKPVPEEQGGGFEIGCDCGTVTQLIIKGAELLTGTHEGAFTCDGCQSVHWFKVAPVPPNPGSDEALAMGCGCPVIDNGRGRVPPYPPDGWWISGDCPVHCPPGDDGSG